MKWYSPGLSATKVASLPPYTRLSGPVTTSKLTRLLRWYVFLVAIGLALQLAHAQWLQIMGLGLLWPGAGFLAYADICTPSGVGHVVMMVGALGLFAVSLFVWFGTGNIVLPPAVWMASALWAAGMQHGPVLPSVVPTACVVLASVWACVGLSMGIRFAWARRQRAADNIYLARHAAGRATVKPAVQTTDLTLAEMSLEHVQRLRFALDRALQPVGEFAGFEVRDQFQTAALRYQVNFLAYGIALTQARFTPAFAGYMHEAQRRLLGKQTQHRVWSYWALENMWGNLRTDADPTARENIMFTGFVALQMSLFQASTGSHDYTEPGSFYLLHPNGQRYAFDLTTLLGRLESEYARSDFYLIACEPNWIYPLCNTIGACAVITQDARRQQTNWARHQQAFRQQLEAEFLDGFGRYVPCRSARTGLALPAIGGVMPQALPCYFLNVVAPDLAHRQWLLLRRRLFDQQGRLRRRAFWPIDTGNYGFIRAAAYGATALAAAELGDEPVYEHCMAALEDECPSVLQDGVIHRAKASVWSHGVELMARANARDGFRHLTTRKPVAVGPRVGQVAYPDVLVASAHADASRGTLQAVLYGGAGDDVQPIEVLGLQPQAWYRVRGATVDRFQADDFGRAGLQVVLRGRTCFVVEPDRGQPWSAAS